MHRQASDANHSPSGIRFGVSLHATIGIDGHHLGFFADGFQGRMGHACGHRGHDLEGPIHDPAIGSNLLELGIAGRLGIIDQDIDTGGQRVGGPDRGGGDQWPAQQQGAGRTEPPTALGNGCFHGSRTKEVESVSPIPKVRIRNVTAGHASVKAPAVVENPTGHSVP